MDFINRIGQRRFAKILFGGSLGLAVLDYVIRYYLDSKAGISVSAMGFGIKMVLGVILLSLGNYFLSMAAERTREYRFFCIFASAILIIVNTILFHLRIDLLWLTLAEVIATLGFLIFIMKHEAKRKIEDKKAKRKTKTDETQEVEIEKE